MLSILFFVIPRKNTLNFFLFLKICSLLNPSFLKPNLLCNLTTGRLNSKTSQLSLLNFFFLKKKSNNLNSTNVPKPLFVFHDYFFNMEYYIIYIPISHIY